MSYTTNDKLVKIRMAEAKDLDAVALIEKESFADGVAESKELFRQRMEVFQKGFLVAEHQDQVVGYICSEL